MRNEPVASLRSSIVAFCSPNFAAIEYFTNAPATGRRSKSTTFPEKSMGVCKRFCQSAASTCDRLVEAGVIGDVPGAVALGCIAGGVPSTLPEELVVRLDAARFQRNQATKMAKAPIAIAAINMRGRSLSNMVGDQRSSWWINSSKNWERCWMFSFHSAPWSSPKQLSFIGPLIEPCAAE